jgi:hypothetical protein
MKLVNVRKGQYSGYYMRWNIVDWNEMVELPSGKYFRNGRQLIEALEIGNGKYSLSSKHSYILEEER